MGIPAGQRRQMEAEMASTEFTRLVLPDGNGKTVAGQLGWVVGQTIRRGDVAEWPKLNGWKVRRRHIGFGGRTERGVYRSGSCLYLDLGLD